jgi:RNA polymerase sigma-70 factor (ECF subfamily)
VTVHRLRRRYGELLRTEIAQTVSSPEEIEDELRDLFAALSGKKS